MTVVLIVILAVNLIAVIYAITSQGWTGRAVSE